MDFYGFYTGKYSTPMNFSAHTRTKTEPHSVPLHLLHHALQSLGNLTTGRNGNLIKLMTEISGNVMPKVQSRA